MKKRLFALLLVGVMIFSLTACGTKKDTSDTGSASDTASKYPKQTIKIAVETYDPTDAEFLQMQDYFKYLQTYFNVQFIYSEKLESADQELEFIENAAIAGAKGVIGYYNVAEGQVIDKCAELGMYYWGTAADKDEIYQQYKNNEYFLGGINYGSEGDYQAGYELANYFIEQGLTKLVYSSGGADFGVQMFVDRRNGFMAAIKDSGKDIKVTDVSGFPGDSFYADQSAALTSDIDGVAASFNGVDFWAQPIASAGKKDTVKLGTIGSLNEAYKEAFANGTISFLESGNIQKFGIPVALIINAVDGNADALKDNGNALNLEQGYWLIKNSDEFNTLYDIQNGDKKVYSTEDLSTLIKNINKNVNADTLKDLVKSYSLEDLQKRKADK